MAGYKSKIKMVARSSAALKAEQRELERKAPRLAFLLQEIRGNDYGKNRSRRSPSKRNRW